MSECQALQVARQGHSIKALVKISSESQALQVARQGHSIKALVERISEGQAFQAFGEAAQTWNIGASSYLRHPIQRKMWLRDLESLEVSPRCV